MHCHSLVGRERLALLATICLAATAALLPASSQAATINGNPLKVFVSDTGNLQANLAGSDNSVFYDPSADSGDAGLFIGFPEAVGAIAAGDLAGPFTQVGPSVEQQYMSVTPGVLTGDGSAANPFTVQTVYKVNDGTTDQLEVTQTVTYRNGETKFGVSYAVENLSGGADAIRFRASEGADLYLEGSDEGLGFFSSGPPRLIGGVNDASGRAGGLEEVTGFEWTNYQADSFGNIWSFIDDPEGDGLTDFVLDMVQDNGVGVEWDTYYTTGLADGATANFSVIWKFGVAGLTLSPASASRTVGETHTVSVTGVDPNGSPLAAKTIRYAVAGASVRSGSVTTDSAGHASISWTGSAAGQDTLSAYVDLNGTGVQEPTEPFGSATVTWTASPPPPPPPPPTPSNVFTLAGKAKVKNGQTLLTVKVPGPGVLTAVQSAAVKITAANGKRFKAFVKPARVVAKKAGSVVLKIKPTKLGRKALRKKGKFSVKLLVTYTPTGGTSSSKNKTVTLKTVRKHKKR